jgi:hypothetical protein
VEVAEPDVDPQGMGFAGLLKSELFGVRPCHDVPQQAHSAPN